jgi:Uma2 family endonuclease
MTESVALSEPKTYTAAPKYVSIEAYFRVEEKSLTKNEYHDGIITPMAGAKLRHNLLSQKVGALMTFFIDEKDLNYKVSNSDTKIRIEDFNKVVYPDALVICETPQYYKGREDTIINPLLVVEILSTSTSKFDRSTKFEWYRTLPSFKEYVLIYQDRQHVVVWTKQNDGAWLPKDYIGEDALAVLHSLHDCPISLKRLYKGV